MNNPENGILIFGGTTEGRICAERLTAEGIACTVCVATEYGEKMLCPNPLLTVHMGRMNREEMARLMRAGAFACVIDATHPHAKAVTEEITAAAAETGLQYLRLQRELNIRENEEGVIRVRDIREAGVFLDGVQGKILVTTGSKELEKLVDVLGDPSRITARVLPSAASLEACSRAGLSGSQIIAMQGPFDTEMNCAVIRHTGAAWLLTKETGETGGYPQKIEAAERCGIGVVAIQAPMNESKGSKSEETAIDRGLDLEHVLETVREICQKESPADTVRELLLAGIGTGAPELRTAQVQQAIEQAQAVFGAESVLRTLKDTENNGRTFVPVYESALILQYLRSHPEVRRAAAVYSGDSGFYSGASSMLEKIREDKGIPDLQVKVMCGISCVSYFASRVGIPWQNWKILSSHGRRCNVVGQVRRHPECFLLLSGEEDARKTGNLLAQAQEAGLLGDLEIICGYELSRPAEEIRRCTAQELCGITGKGLYVLYIRHEKAGDTPVLPGLSDDVFIRGKAPMTASEIRALSLCRLGLTPRSVVWDVGAGTGSVSVEAALTCPEGRVYSVECKEEAISLLYRNRAKFCLENMEIVEGRAPLVLNSLPDPTHVFIGGSGGEIGEILKLVLERSPRARVVVNCITAETLSELQKALPELPAEDIQCIQVSVQRGEKLGSYHYLRALNPVFIISFRGKA